MKRAATTLPEYGPSMARCLSSLACRKHRRTFYYGFDQQLDKTIEFLRSGNYLNVDIFALKDVAGGRMTAPSAPFPSPSSQTKPSRPRWSFRAKHWSLAYP